MSRMTDLKERNFDLNKKLVRFIRIFEIQALHEKQFKTMVGRKISKKRFKQWDI